MVRLATTEGLILLTTCRLLRDEVRIGTAETRHVDGLVGIDGDLMLSSLLDGVEVVVHHALAVVMLTTGDDVAYVAALDSGVAVVSHKLVRLLHMALVVRDRAGGLVVHDELHALALSVVTELSDVEVGVRSDEVKDTVLAVAEPVFPTDIPALDEDSIEAVLSGEVDVLLDVLRIGSVLAIRLHLRVVGLTDLHIGQVVGVRPRALTRDHLPPDTYILDRLDPVGRLIGTRLVEVVRQLRGEDIACITADDSRTPRGVEGRFDVPTVALCVRRQLHTEGHRLVIQIEVDSWEVNECCFVEVDVDPLIALEHQRRLYARLREGGLGAVLREGLVEEPTDLRETAVLVVVLLSVVVTGDPVRLVVARHSELGELALDDVEVTILAAGELIAEAEPVIEETEADSYGVAIALLLERDEQFVVVVADRLDLAPDRLPSLIEGRLLRVRDLEALVEGLLRIGHLQTEMTGTDDLLPIGEGEAVHRCPVLTQREVQLKALVGRADRLSQGAPSRGQDQREGRSPVLCLLHAVVN